MFFRAGQVLALFPFLALFFSVANAQKPSESPSLCSFAHKRAVKAQPPTHPLQDQMDVLHTELWLTLDSDSRDITDAAAEITFRSLADGLDQGVFDFDDNNGQFSVSAVSRVADGLPLSFSQQGNRLFIDLPEALDSQEETTVRVEYGGRPRFVSGSGYLRSTHSGGVPILFTNSQPYDARTWWPCKDVPEDKLTIDLHVTVPDEEYQGYPLSVVANGSLESVETNGRMRTYHWSEQYPVSTYLVAITCSNYRAASATYTSLDGTETMEVAHQVLPQSYAEESGEAPRTVEVLEFFADSFGEYPFLEEKYWTATWGLSYGMEHQTATSMPDGNLATPYHRRNVHELAHMWFGDGVTLDHYDHLWIQEGWATYCEALFYEELYGKTAYHDYVNDWRTSDAYPIVSDRADSFNLSVVYRKGAWVLHMLRRVIGEEAFFEGARSYMMDPELRFDTATSADVQRHFEQASGRDLEAFFQQWLYRASRPRYDWSWSTRRVDGESVLEIDLEQTQAGGVYTMPIDFRVNYGDNTSRIVTVENDQREQVFTVDIEEKPVRTVEFDPENWLLETNQDLTPDAPPPPVLRSVIGNGSSNSVELAWSAPEIPSIVGFRIRQYGPDFSTGTLVAGTDELGPSDSSHTVAGIRSGEAAYFAISAVAERESAESDLYGVRLGGGDAPVLVVDGYDRQTREEGTNHHYAAMHGRSIAANSVAFDTVANETLNVEVDLENYQVVGWMLAEESTDDETFDSFEQDIVRGYLRSGGSLFVNGNEIAWDLDWSGSPDDRQFMEDFLRARYEEDDSEDYSLTGTGGSSLFETESYSFGSDPQAYFPNYPDVLQIPGESSEPALRYRNHGGIAGIQYFGPFAGSTAEGRLVYLGFGFETLSNETHRIEVMRRVLEVLLDREAPGSEGLLLW